MNRRRRAVVSVPEIDAGPPEMGAGLLWTVRRDLQQILGPASDRVK